LLPNTLELFGHIENKTILVAIIRSLKVEDRFLNNQQVIMNRFSTYAASKQTGANWTDKGTTKQSDSSARDDARDSPTRGTEQNRTEQNERFNQANSG
jgi:hypothetical protein